VRGRRFLVVLVGFVVRQRRRLVVWRGRLVVRGRRFVVRGRLVVRLVLVSVPRG